MSKRGSCYGINWCRSCVATNKIFFSCDMKYQVASKLCAKLKIKGVF